MRTTSKDFNPIDHVSQARAKIKRSRVAGKSSAVGNPTKDVINQAKEFTFKVINLTKGQKSALNHLIGESYALRGYLLSQMAKGENPFLMEPWLIYSYTINNGKTEVPKCLHYLDNNMIEYLLDDLRKLYKLVKDTKASPNVFLEMNDFEQKCLRLNNYGFSHNFISSDMMRIMGLNQPIQLQWVEQLHHYKSIMFGPIRIKMVGSGFFATLTCII